MTKSAKQDTSQAPAQAAGDGAAATESAATEPGTPADEATTGQPAAAPAGEGEGGEAAPDLDETKRKFREALERKHQVHADGQGNSGLEASKISGAHGPAASRRNFRRKSG
jgi:Family of unknown function (DUF5302)